MRFWLIYACMYACMCVRIYMRTCLLCSSAQDFGQSVKGQSKGFYLLIIPSYFLTLLSFRAMWQVSFSLQWYEIDAFGLPNQLRQKFVQSSMDEETEQFLALCVEKSGWVFTQFFHSIVQVFLGFMVSMTTINGYVQIQLSCFGVAFRREIKRDSMYIGAAISIS